MRPPDTSRDGTAFAAARLHSHRVKLVKRILPLAAVAIAVIFSWFTFFVLPPTANVLTLNNTDGTSSRLVMTQPRVEGYSRTNQLYMLTAARAIQDPIRPGVIELEEIDATMPLGTRGSVQIQAQSGVFDNINGRMLIDKPFEIETSAGVAAHFLTAEVDIRTSQFVSDQKVEIYRQNEHLTAGRLRILDGGQIFMFEGGVKLTISAKHL